MGPCCRCPVCPGGEGLLPGRERLSQLHHGLGVRLRACSPAPPASPMLSGHHAAVLMEPEWTGRWLGLVQHWQSHGLRSHSAGSGLGLQGRLRGPGTGLAGGEAPGVGGAARGAPSRSRFPREPAASTFLSPPPGAALLGRIRRQRGDGPLREESRASVGLSGPIRKCTAFLWPHPPSVPAARQSCHTLNRAAQADRCPARCPRRTPR